jgi:hypothetical protein
VKEKPFRIVGSINQDFCVAKVKYGDKYVIAKYKDSIKGLKTMENALNAFLRGGVNNQEGYYFPFYNHIKRHPGGKISVEYLSEELEKDAYKVLILEQQALDAGRYDPHMLNNQTMSHIPAYDEATGLYGWIPPAAVLNYRNWLKRRKRPRKSVG